MTTVIFSNGGTLDKFIGDAIMAVWGNVRSLGTAQDAKCCARAALGMRRELRQLNQGWREQGRMGLGMGVGVNHGEVIVGNIGSQDRMDPTVIGDAVNLASRLEALTRTYGVDMLVGASVAELVRDEVYLRSVARVQVKGKTKPVDVFTFVAGRGEENGNFMHDAQLQSVHDSERPGQMHMQAGPEDRDGLTEPFIDCPLVETQRGDPGHAPGEDRHAEADRHRRPPDERQGPTARQINTEPTPDCEAPRSTSGSSTH